MSYRKIGKNKYKVDAEITVDGQRFRGSKRITTELKGSQLKGYINSIENKLYDELKIKAQDKDALGQITFNEFGKFHIENRKLQAKTKDWYEDYLGGLVKKLIGKKKIIEITHKDIENLFETLKTTKTNRGTYYSPKTIKHYHTAVHAVFTTAVKKEIIKTNPASDIKLDPIKRSLNDNYLSPSQIETYAEKLRDHEDFELELYFIISITCGLRPSELAGLKWKKINFDKGKVLINRALVLTKSEGYVYKHTKTEDERTLILTNYLILMLKQHKENEIEKLRSLGIFTSIEDHYVFTNPNGDHLKETTQRDKWRDFCKKYELKYVTPYGLRHSCATLLAYNRIPIINIASQLGHVNTSTTDIYVHAAEEVNEEVKTIMEEITAPKLKIAK